MGLGSYQKAIEFGKSMNHDLSLYPHKNYFLLPFIEKLACSNKIEDALNLINPDWNAILKIQAYLSITSELCKNNHLDQAIRLANSLDELWKLMAISNLGKELCK